MKTYLGIELGSTRIKAVAVDEDYRPVLYGSSTWKSDYADGIWTYPMEKVWSGLRETLQPFKGKQIARAGISGMMHGLLAFDEDWRLLAPFRTWQNTITGEAAEKLTALFNFNIPQRWSIAHLYQAVLNDEPYTDKIAHITTLSGYVHYMLTGVNVVGVGEASGMFPIDSTNCCFDRVMLGRFDMLAASQGFHRKLRDILPPVLVAGQAAGSLTAAGAELLDGALPVGLPFAPPEGDAGTGMVATNSVAERTGNISAGTSIFTMVVLETPIRHVYPEIDMVTTPAGRPVAMVHCNNGTNDMNMWSGILRDAVRLFGAEPDDGELFAHLYEVSLEGDADCGGVVVYNYLAGEGITRLDEGRPMVIRRADSRFTLANFIRAQLYSTIATLKIGMELLSREGVQIDSLSGHGGLFKTPLVGQKYMAAACNTSITCMKTAGEGGPYGMALLAAYLEHSECKLEDFLRDHVFCGAESTTVSPDAADVAGFEKYLSKYREGLAVERKAVECL